MRSLFLAVALAMATTMTAVTQMTKPVVVDGSLALPDAHGVPRRPLATQPGALAAIFFVTHDCPISNHYAPEFHRICQGYAGRGVTCRLVYVDPSLTDGDALAHARRHGLDTWPVIVDRQHRLVRATGAEIAPEAVVIEADGRVGYRGRIDDVFVAWGQSRRQPRTRDLRDALDALLAGTPVPRPETPSVGCIIGDLLPTGLLPLRDPPLDRLVRRGRHDQATTRPTG